MKLINKVCDFFTLDQLPVPSDTYEVSDEFVEKLRASQSQGSVSVGDGRFYTREKKDELYNSLKDYNFLK